MNSAKWLCQPCGHKHGTKSAEPGFFGRCSLCQMVTKVARADKFGYKPDDPNNKTVLDIGASSDNN